MKDGEEKIGYGEEKIEDEETEIEKEKEKKREKVGSSISLIAIILISTLIVLAIVNYQPNPPPKGDKLNETTIINMSAEEKNFRTWFVLSYGPIREDLKCISKAAKSENMSRTETCARILKENSNRSLNQIESYNVTNISTTVRSGLSIYKISLENYNKGGEILETGTRNKNASIMGTAIQYIQNGTNYANDAMKVLKVNNTDTSGTNNSSDVGSSSKGVKLN